MIKFKSIFAALPLHITRKSLDIYQFMFINAKKLYQMLVPEVNCISAFVL